MKSSLLIPLALIAASPTLSCDLGAESRDIGDDRSLGSPVEMSAQALLTPGAPLPSCGSQSLFATHSPLSPADIRGISPMGSLEPPIHTLPDHHLYMHIRRAQPNNPNSPVAVVPVYALGDARIVAVTHKIRDNQSAYTLHFKPCEDVLFYYEYLNGLSPALAAAIGDVPTTGICLGDVCLKEVDVPITAGQELGTAGLPSFPKLAIGVMDERRAPQPFVNPSRYMLPPELLGSLPPEVPSSLITNIFPNSVYQHCPLHYFSPGVRGNLEEYLGSPDGAEGRTRAPTCGTHMQDLEGTAQGAWSKQANSVFGEANDLALMHNEVDPSIAVFSVGTQVPLLAAGEYRVSSLKHRGSRNRDFSDVMPNKIYCYDGLETPSGASVTGRILVEIFGEGDLTANRLRIEYQPGSQDCKDLPLSFTAQATEFAR